MLEETLTALKYLGLLLIFVTSLCATLFETQTKDEKGRTGLNAGGKIALLLAILGLLMGVGTTYVADRIDEGKEAAKQAVERERALQIILSAQPVRSLEFQWAFPSIPKELAETVRQAVESVADVADDDEMKYSDKSLRKAISGAQERREILYPWLSFMASGKWECKPVVALVPLDSANATRLTFGLLQGAPWGTVEATDALSIYRFDPTSPNLFALPPHWNKTSFPTVEASERSVSISMNLPPSQFSRATQSASVPSQPTAAFPEQFRVIVLGAIKKLPIDREDYSVEEVALPWAVEWPDAPGAIPDSRMVLAPNYLPEARREYTVRFAGRRKVTFGGGQENKPELLCKAGVFVAKAVAAKVQGSR